jgi:hypothetical protein
MPSAGEILVKWTQNDNRLTVQMPEAPPYQHAIALKIARM